MITNQYDVPLPLAVWLAAPNGYDFIPDPNTISATSLLRPIRSLVLGRRALLESEPDVTDLVASALGTSVHTAAEVAWKDYYRVAMANLGYPESMIAKIRVNPEEPEEGTIPIYIEQRSFKQIAGFTVSGKYDFVVDGSLHDIKTTSTYNYINGSNDDKYRLQGSIYRWLNPEIITSDTLHINYLFTDWKQYQALADPKYPKQRCVTKHIDLLSMEQTETFLRNKLNLLKEYEQLDQSQIPECTPAELWMDPPKFAYYKDKTKTTRATKLYDIKQDAIMHYAKDSGKGLIVERKGEPKFCKYCDANSICSQAEKFVLDGLLKL